MHFERKIQNPSTISQNSYYKKNADCHLKYLYFKNIIA